MCADPIQARLRTRGESDDAGKYVEVLREEANTKGTLYCEVRLVGDSHRMYAAARSGCALSSWSTQEVLRTRKLAPQQKEPNQFTFVPVRGGSTTQDDLAGFQVKQQAYSRTGITRRSCLPRVRASEQRAVCAECSPCRARASESDVAPNCDAGGAAARDR